MKRREKRMEVYRIALLRLEELAAKHPDYESQIQLASNAVQSCIASAVDAHSMEASFLLSHHVYFGYLYHTEPTTDSCADKWGHAEPSRRRQ